MIDEKKLIEDLEEQYKSLIPEDDTDFCKIWQIKQDIKIIETQPQVGVWIPISERLPETNKAVLIYTNTGEIDVDYYGKMCNDFIGLKGTHMTAIAWMPLPEPYEGE